MSNQQATLPGAAHIGRVTLRVSDLNRVVEYYQTVIGLTIHHRDDDQAVLGTGTQPLLVMVAAPDIPPRDRTETGLFHVAFRVPSRQALADALGRIHDHEQCQLAGASDHLVSEALYLTDPEGNGVEVYCDRPRDAWPNPDPSGAVGMDTRPLDIEALPDRSQETTVPDDTTVGHVHLESSELAAVRSFYVDDIGLRVRDRFGESALFVAAGDYHHHVGLNTWNERTEPHTGRGLHRFELVVPDPALNAVRTRLDASGRRFTTIEDGIEVTGPDGIDLRVVSE